MHKALFLDFVKELTMAEDGAQGLIFVAVALY
jgi:hypothetical protein